jgi:hypothetical protein
MEQTPDHQIARLREHIAALEKDGSTASRCWWSVKGRLM